MFLRTALETTAEKNGCKIKRFFFCSMLPFSILENKTPPSTEEKKGTKTSHHYSLSTIHPPPSLIISLVLCTVTNFMFYVVYFFNERKWNAHLFFSVTCFLCVCMLFTILNAMIFPKTEQTKNSKQATIRN